MTTTRLHPRPAGLPEAVKWCGWHAQGGLPSAGWKCPECDQRNPATVEAVVKRPDAGLANEAELAARLNDAGLVGWEPQFYWATNERTETGKPRLYRADFAFPKQMVLVESEGGAHTVRRQHAADCLRASIAAALGYRMVRMTKDMIVDAGPYGAVALIRRALDVAAALAARNKEVPK